VKTHSVIVCFLLMGSLLAQTKSPSSEVPAKPQAAPESTAASAQIKIDPAKEADIRRLLDLTKFALLATQIMEGMEGSIKPLMMSSFPPGEYRERLIDLFFAKFHSKISADQLLGLAVPIYEQYYTHDEIKGLIQFYETPLGQKLTSVQAQISGELQAAGRKWGEGLGRDSMLEVLAEHPELATALEAAKKGAQPQ
jgi:hypothetical protein